MSIKCIIFDLGGVVLTNDWYYCPKKDKEIFYHFGLTENDTGKAWNKYWPLYKIGKITEDQFWKRFLKKSKPQKINTDIIKKIYKKYQGQIENMPNLVKKLKKKYKVAALTNVGKEWLEYKLNKSGLNKTFDIVVSSCYSGVAKPDEKIYEILIEKLGLAPSLCVFIDDKESCLLPAKKIGLHTILFKNQNQLEEELKKMNVSF